MNKIEFLYNRDKYKGVDSTPFLQHYGILGQKWGQRRWQNADGTFNQAGKERYFGSNKVRTGTNVESTGKGSKNSYDPPYSYNDIVKNYGKETADRLMSDPAHKFRAESGIELIHKEPNLEELERIWKNWQSMDSKMKEESDKKSIELFGVTNEEHYNQIKNEYNEDKIGGLFKKDYAKEAARAHRLDERDEYRYNKKTMSKEDFKQWKEQKKADEDRRKEAKQIDAEVEDLRQKIAKGKNISEKEYNKLSDEGKKLYDQFQEMKENGWNAEAKLIQPGSKVIKDSTLIYTKKIDNKDFGDKFSIYQNDIEEIPDINKKTDKAIKFLNDKNSYNKIINNLMNEQYEIYKDVMKQDGKNNIMSKSEFIKSEPLAIKEIGFDSWSSGGGDIAIDFEPKNPNTPWFGFDFEIWVDPNTGKITDFYQS